MFRPRAMPSYATMSSHYLSVYPKNVPLHVTGDGIRGSYEHFAGGLTSFQTCVLGVLQHRAARLICRHTV